MVWRIMHLLPQCIMNPGFEPLKTYLEEDRGYFRTWQLSRQIANLFDQYCIYRPNMILRWEAGNGSGWQAELWRLLTRGQPASHKAAMQRRFFSALRDAGQERILKLPQRIAVFGISTLPLFHMQVLAALCKHCEVNLFLMNPSQEYWAEIKSKYEITRMLRKEGGHDPSPDYLHLENGKQPACLNGRAWSGFSRHNSYHDPEMKPALSGRQGTPCCTRSRPISSIWLTGEQRARSRPRSCSAAMKYAR